MGRDVNFLHSASLESLLTRRSVLVGDDNPAFEGVFEFCSISAGGSICVFPQPFSLTIMKGTINFRRRTTDSVWGRRHRNQLGGGTTPREKARGLRLLLH